MSGPTNNSEAVHRRCQPLHLAVLADLAGA